MSDKARLEWKGGLLFRGETGGRELLLDGNRQAACSPVEAVALSLAGCMAIDVVHILGRMRADAKAVNVAIESERAATDPKRFTHLRLRFEISGDKIKPNDVERALALSAEKYCSVYHSLRTDIEVETSYVLL